LCVTSTSSPGSIVWRDPMRQILTTVNALQVRGIGLQLLQENIETTSATGRLIFHIFTPSG
jgi:DNA invertase Pin-like site-specific DNA recombinase